MQSTIFDIFWNESQTRAFLILFQKSITKKLILHFLVFLEHFDLYIESKQQSAWPYLKLRFHPLNEPELAFYD